MYVARTVLALFSGTFFEYQDVLYEMHTTSTWAIGLLELVQTWRHSHLVQNEELKVTNTWWRKNILAAVDDINKVKKLRVHYIHLME